MSIYRSYIDGRWQSPDSVRPVSLRNPANHERIVGRVEYADIPLAFSAMDAAQNAGENWRKISVKDRVARLSKILKCLRERRPDIAGIITIENGKTLRESLAEVDASLNEAEYQLQFLSESTVEQIGKNEIWYEPLGVVLLITPWNFPLATILRKLIPAVAVGNTAVVKASELTPLTAVALFRIIEETEVPAGVVNLVIAEGSTVGPALIKHPALRAISLTGSTNTGFAIAEQLVNNSDVRFQAEMGGKNAVVILADADLEAASEAAVSSGFACCGQWCTGTSRVIAEGRIYQSLLDLLIARAKRIVVGNGMDKATTMGPLISAVQLQKVERAVVRAKEEGARLVIGGRRPCNISLNQGHYYEPTIFADVTPEMTIAREEIFGPILGVMPARDADEALRLANDSRYGLSFSVFTRRAEIADHFMREIRAGVCHVNLPTVHRDPALPLLGWGDAGRGLAECGRFARDFFTRTKAIYRKGT